MRRVGVAVIVGLCAVAACFAGDAPKPPEPRSWPMLAAEQSAMLEARAYFTRLEQARAQLAELEKERPAREALVGRMFDEARQRIVYMSSPGVQVAGQPPNTAETARVGSLGIALDRGVWVETAPPVKTKP